jgi:arylsulfatase A-like enzyme
MKGKMTRREFLGMVATASATLPPLGQILSAGQKTAATTNQFSKPNIILIMADDLGYAGLGCYGQELIQTPYIDKMAAGGMRFTNFYSGNTVCIPSRVSLLMGLHPGHAPIRDNFPPHLPDFSGYMTEFPSDLWPPKLPTIGQVMKKAGYKTAQFGKLEAGIPLPKGKMTELGWDYWFGFKETDDAAQYYPVELWKNDEKIIIEENKPEDIRKVGIVGKRGVYSQDLFIEEILKFIKENKDKPFFIYFPTQIPHGRHPKFGEKIQVPEIGPYADKDWTLLEKLYASMITRLDFDVGRIIQELKNLGIETKTVLFFTSDNGDENSYYDYTDRFKATGPLRGKKRFLYEGGIRVPMIAYWPGVIKPGSVCDLPAAAWDFMATLAELARVQAPAHTDGVSLVPTLTGQNDRQAQREYLYWEYHFGKQQAVRIGRYKGIRFGGTKEPIELYDLMTDIGESKNIASSHPELVKKINSLMEEARQGSEFTRYWPLPEHRLYNVKWDKWIFDQLEKGIDWDKKKR